MGRGVGGWLDEAALGCTVGAGKEEGNALAMDGEGDEAEMMGAKKEWVAERRQGRRRCRPAMGLGGEAVRVEASEGTDGGWGRCRKGSR